MACSLRSPRGLLGCLISHASLLSRHGTPCHYNCPPHSYDLTPHTGQPQGLPLHPSKTAAVPQLRHSARSRGIHVPLHSNLDAATTRSMTACAGQRCPITHTSPRLSSPLPPPSYDLTPPSYDLTPPSSLLTPPSSLLTPHSYDLTPHSYDLTPHSYDLTPPSYALTPHSYDLTPHPSLLTPTTSCLTPPSSLPPAKNPPPRAAPLARLRCLPVRRLWRRHSLRFVRCVLCARPARCGCWSPSR